MSRKHYVSKSKGNKENKNLGAYSGDSGYYAGLEFIGESDIDSSHIKEYDKSDYLDYINVDISPQNDNSKLANLFQINTCNNGKTLELHIATGKQLKDTNYSLPYQSTKELLLHAEKDSKEIQMKFIVYNYTEGNKDDLEIYECGRKTGRNISVYNEIVSILEGDIDGTPDSKSGSILVGQRP